jgi:hypothetical protein
LLGDGAPVSQAFHAMKSPVRRLILAVTQNPARYAGLPAIVDSASNAIMAKINLYGAQVRGDRYDLVFVDEKVGDCTGYQVVQTLRKLMLYDGEFFVVKEAPSALDDACARQAGAARAVGADLRSLLALVEGTPSLPRSAEPPLPGVPSPGVAKPPSIRPAAAATVPLAPFLPTVIGAMREFLASEAEPRVLALYQEMSKKRPHATVTFDELVDEAAQRLLDDAGDQRAFIKFANTRRSAVK